MRYAVYDGRENDLYLALPEFERLQRCFKLVFDKEAIDAPLLLLGRKKYYIDKAPLLTLDKGYYCIRGKFKGSKGLHHIPLHRLAYRAFYGVLKPGMHIHHIDGNKKNNRADNLVALTEEEHCDEHGRDVRVLSSLFKSVPAGVTNPKPISESLLQHSYTSQNQGNLLRELSEAARAVFKKEKDDLLSDIGHILTEPKLLLLLKAEPTPENIAALVSSVRKFQQSDSPETVLEHLCAFTQY